jgi:hypothetical protein
MTRAAWVVGCLALAGCALPMPQMPQPRPTMAAPAAPVNPGSAQARFITAAAANGCVVDASNSAAVLAAATLSAQDMGRIMSDMRASGQGEIAPDGRAFRVTTGACA